MPSSSGIPFSAKRSLDRTVSKPPARHLVAFCDGGARGNPGPAGYGVVLQNETGEKVATLSEYLGHQTNNFAEYQGLIAALEYATQHGHRALLVISDSELLVRQIKGIYKVKNSTLQHLHTRAKELIAELDWFSVSHVLREKNREADSLANAAMDRGLSNGGRSFSFSSSASAPLPPVTAQELNGVVREGKIVLLGGTLPEGTRVQIRVK